MKGVERFRWPTGAMLAGVLFSLAGVAQAAAPPVAEKAIPAIPALSRPVPEGVDDLRAIQKQVKAVLDKVVPATVGLQIGSSAGSGVIVNAEGFILTAGHVSGKADQPVRIILHDGRVLRGTTLGGNQGIDSGMIKITDKDARFPWVDLGASEKLKVGQWCVAVGHPGGFKPGRSPVVRVGRIVSKDARTIQTDCTLVGGDSGGPLFDLAGRVIAIHSRIGLNITQNYHVPVDTYKETWDRLAKGEVWGGGLFGLGGGRPRPVSRAWLGISVEGDAEACRISDIARGSPAEKAGIRVDDILVKFDGKKVTKFDDLAGVIKDKKPGDQVEVVVERGMAVVTVKLTLTERPKE